MSRRGRAGPGRFPGPGDAARTTAGAWRRWRQRAGRHRRVRASLRGEPTAAPGGRHRRRGSVALPALGAGILVALALPPWGLWILAFPGAALLWWHLGGLPLRARLLAGFAAGLGMFVPGLWWVTDFNTYGAAVLMVAESLAPALACAAAPRGGRGRVPALAGAMVLVEALRDTWPFGGLPLGGAALGQAGGPLLDSARLGGPLLLVGLLWLAGGGMGLLAVRALRWAGAVRSAGGQAQVARSFAAPHGQRPVAAGMLALAVVAGLAAWGSAAADGGPALRTLRVAAVQGGGVRGLRQSEVEPVAVYRAQFAATAQIPAHDGGRPPVLVVWPEDVVALGGALVGSPQERQLADLARSLHATLIVGVTEDEPEKRFRNEVVAFGPGGRLVARYEKVHRVPFGEYVPYRGFFSHLADLSAVPRDAIPGHGDGVLHTPVGALGAMISYEVFYAERGRVPTRAGAQLLVDPTNTSSYITSQVPTQEIAAARLQAVAEGRDLVQAAPTGFSAVIDHTGRVVARTPLASRAVVVRDVALRSGRTLYERGGDLPVLLAAAAAVVAGWALALTAPGEDARRSGARWRRPPGTGAARRPRP